MKTSEPLREEKDLKIAEDITSPAWCSHVGSSQTWLWAVAAEGGWQSRDFTEWWWSLTSTDFHKWQRGVFDICTLVGSILR